MSAIAKRPDGTLIVTLRVTLKPGRDDALIAVVQAAPSRGLAAVVREAMRGGTIRAGVPGVTGAMSGLGSDAFAGPFARWSAKAAVAKLADLDATRAKIAALLEREQRLDHIDRVEVLNSKVWLDSRTGKMDDEERSKMWTMVGTLPAGATRELRSLGMLDL